MALRILYLENGRADKPDEKIEHIRYTRAWQPNFYTSSNVRVMFTDQMLRHLVIEVIRSTSSPLLTVAMTVYNVASHHLELTLAALLSPRKATI
jgi:hypothetical protein